MQLKVTKVIDEIILIIKNENFIILQLTAPCVLTNSYQKELFAMIFTYSEMEPPQLDTNQVK